MQYSIRPIPKKTPMRLVEEEISMAVAERGD
jgi:hypothetical protein